MKTKTNTPDFILRAYAYCEKITKNHYENFPVASLLLPKKLRRPISVIYAFGRTADDIADEGNSSPEERLEALALYQKYLYPHGDTAQDNTPNLIFVALHSVITEYQLPLSLFLDLLSAFKQDIYVNEYQTLTELKEYCRQSANSIGRLLLHVSQLATEQNLYYSDCICTAIQLINFLQDLDEDLSLRNRCYLPKDIMQAFDLKKEDIQDIQNINDINDIKEKLSSSSLIKLNAVIQVILAEVQQLLELGNPLTKILTGRLGFELKLTVVCAFKMVDKLKQRKHPLLRPKLRVWEWPLLLFQTLFYEFTFSRLNHKPQNKESECQVL